MIKDLLKNKFVLCALCLLVGIGIGAVFYPSKTIEKEIESKYQQQIQKLSTEKKNIETQYNQQIQSLKLKEKVIILESEKKITSLKEENSTLKQKVKKKTIKIIKPDGTIVEQTVRESETEVVSKIITNIKSEFNVKVSNIEKKWEKIHKERVLKIKEDYEKKIKEKEDIIITEKEKSKTTINQRNFGFAFGVKTDNIYYSSVSYDIYGPFFLNLHFESNKELSDTGAGFGIGIRF